MKKRTGLFIAMLILAAASIALAEYTETQRNLLATWAARADACRKLATQIKALRIGDGKHVADFLSQDQRIETALRLFMRRARPVGRPRHYSDGSCEVDLEIPVDQAIAELKRLRSLYYNGKDFEAGDFDKIKAEAKADVIRAMGEGSAPQGLSEAAVAKIEKSDELPPLLGLGWEDVTAEGQLSAKWAAACDAYEKMLRRIEALQISSTSTVRDFLATGDKDSVQLERFIRRSAVAGEERYMPDQVCEVDLACKVADVIAFLKKLSSADGRDKDFKDADFDKISIHTAEDVLKATGCGIPPEKHIQPAATEAKLPDWASQAITASGTAALPDDEPDPAKARLIAARIAQAEATRNLAEKVYAVKIDRETTVQDFTSRYPGSRGDIETSFSAARVTSTRWLDDGRCEVTVRLSLKRLYKIARFFKSGQPGAS